MWHGNVWVCKYIITQAVHARVRHVCACMHACMCVCVCVCVCADKYIHIYIYIYASWI